MAAMTFTTQACVIAAVAVAFAVQSAAAQPSDNTLIAPPSATVPYGKLSLDWWRWALGPKTFTFLEPTSCTGRQIYKLPNYAPVYFLAGTNFSTDPEPVGSVDVVRRKGCTVPKGSYIMIPAVNSASALNPALNQTETLTNGTITTNSTLYLLDQNIPSTLVAFTVDLDSKLVTKKSYTALSPLEPFAAKGANITNAKGQSYGNWIVLRPLPRGPHTVRVCTTVDTNRSTPATFKFCITNILKVL
jgi:hypothetical protein